MSQSTWKLLIYLCGDAVVRLPAGVQQVDLAALLGRPAGAFAATQITLVVQAHHSAARQAVRLAQQPGQALAQVAATAEAVDDSPAARDSFIAWAEECYPSDRTLLLLGDCKAAPDALYAPPGTVFELVSSPDGPDQRPLTQATLAALQAEVAQRGGPGRWLGNLLAPLLDDGERPDAPAEPAFPAGEPERDWTILLYLAGDNGKIFETPYGNVSLMAEMTTAGRRDIGEVQKVGTTDQVAVLAQFDTLGEEGTYRLEIRRGRTTEEDVVETIAEANTGHPAGLAQFIVWGMQRCPARRTMLVLWNHGLGWKDDDVYALVRAMSRAVRQGRKLRRRNVAAFRSTAARIKDEADRESDDHRGILCDDSSMDLLTNVEMSQALRVAEIAADEEEVEAIFHDPARLAEAMAAPQRTAKRRLNLIGMDACLMAMLEVQYQLRSFAEVVVASQEVEPMDGWPYTAIVERLNADPGMSPQALGALIVDEYAKSYGHETRVIKAVTQSAVAQARMEQTKALVAAFAQALSDAYPHDRWLQLAYLKAKDLVRRTFEDQDYVDLVHFVQDLLARYEGDNTAVHRTGQALADWLRSAGGPVIRNEATGSEYRDKAFGISIYLPQEEPSPYYKELDFADSGWLDFLQRVFTFSG